MSDTDQMREALEAAALRESVLTAERDRARDLAVALEQDHARLQEDNAALLIAVKKLQTTVIEAALIAASAIVSAEAHR